MASNIFKTTLTESVVGALHSVLVDKGFLFEGVGECSGPEAELVTSSSTAATGDQTPQADLVVVGSSLPADWALVGRGEGVHVLRYSPANLVGEEGAACSAEIRLLLKAMYMQPSTLVVALSLVPRNDADGSDKQGTTLRLPPPAVHSVDLGSLPPSVTALLCTMLSPWLTDARRCCTEAAEKRKRHHPTCSQSDVATTTTGTTDRTGTDKAADAPTGTDEQESSSKTDEPDKRLRIDEQTPSNPYLQPVRPGMYHQPPRPARPGNPFLQPPDPYRPGYAGVPTVGGGDRDPFGPLRMDPPGARGSLVGERHPFFQPQPSAYPPTLPSPDGRLPPGAVPPGARFDPFGPPGPNHPHGPAGPDPDHLPMPPGSSFMFM